MLSLISAIVWPIAKIIGFGQGTIGGLAAIIQSIFYGPVIASGSAFAVLQAAGTGAALSLSSSLAIIGSIFTGVGGAVAWGFGWIPAIISAPAVATATVATATVSTATSVAISLLAILTGIGGFFACILAIPRHVLETIHGELKRICTVTVVQLKKLRK